MAKMLAALPGLLVGTPLIGQRSPPLAWSDAAGEAPVVEPNRPALRVRIYAGDGASNRFTNDITAGYAVVALPLAPGRTVLILVAHEGSAAMRARLLDDPPWRAPRVAQPIAFEPRRDMAAPHRVIEGAWVAIPPDAPPRMRFLVIELGAEPGRGVARDPLVEVHDPGLPSTPRSLARAWTARSFAADLGSPLEHRRRLGAQPVWPAGDGIPDG